MLHPCLLLLLLLLLPLSAAFDSFASLYSSQCCNGIGHLTNVVLSCALHPNPTCSQSPPSSSGTIWFRSIVGNGGSHPFFASCAHEHEIGATVGVIDGVNATLVSATLPNGNAMPDASLAAAFCADFKLFPTAKPDSHREFKHTAAGLSVYAELLDFIEITGLTINIDSCASDQSYSPTSPSNDPLTFETFYNHPAAPTLCDDMSILPLTRACVDDGALSCCLSYPLINAGAT